MRKQFTSLFLCSIGLLLISSYWTYGQKSLGTRYINYGAIARENPGLEGNLNLLNLWQEQPEYIQELYKTAFQILSSDMKASFADVTNDANFLQLCDKYVITHIGGPLLGDVSSNSAKVWIRTIKPARVEVQININGTEKKYGPVYSNATTDMTAVIEITGLNPNSSYKYAIIIDGKPININGEPKITTTPEESSDTRIAFGTCFHRWGLCNQIMSDQIKSRNPMALLLGGDIAVQDRLNNVGLHRADYLLRDFQPAWKSLVSSIPVYAAWDDHDYFGNDLYNIPKGYSKEDKEQVWKVFRHAWNNPSFGFGDEGKGVFFRTRIGPADVIMLDNRYFRKIDAYRASVEFFAKS